jgi:hypothetical protein
MKYSETKWQRSQQYDAIPIFYSKFQMKKRNLGDVRFRITGNVPHTVSL